MRESLTDAQAELLRWLKDWFAVNDRPPSIRDMMVGVGRKSPAPIQALLYFLREKGYLDWDEGQARTLRLLHEFDQSPRTLEIAITINPNGTQRISVKDPLGDKELSNLIAQQIAKLFRGQADAQAQTITNSQSQDSQNDAGQPAR